MKSELLTINDASNWATKYLRRTVTISNISYLVQYAKIRKYQQGTMKTRVSLKELKKYYDENVIKKQKTWKEKLGNDLNWNLSFDHLREADTTKHVHRLHPYKGKFIPQLVEYFLNDHINKFKKEIFFHKGNVMLDPFMGSGTAIIQASELGIHSIGIDISEFNCLISKVKSDKYDFIELTSKLNNSLSKATEFSKQNWDNSFKIELKNRLSEFNEKYFPNPQFKHDVIDKKIDEKKFGEEKLNQFLKENKEFLTKNGIKEQLKIYNESAETNFLNKWFFKRIKQELSYYLKLIESVEDEKVKNVMRVILSRTARSCRSTTHSDLATLKNPQIGPYYCSKHKKICTTLNSILKHLKKNTNDTLNRLEEFSTLKKDTQIGIICGDSREVSIFNEIKKQNPEFYKLFEKNKIDGVFTSPPYVGQIDYHKQHEYAYDLFNISKQEDKEIGPKYKGTGKKAKEDYIEGISKVLINVSKFVKDDGNFFIVANDKSNLYPTIAEKSNLKIVNQFKRPVLNRTERDRQPYAEIIFHMKKN